ncbi:MAG: 50S ribosomal protein L23 [Microgenomates group bacterium GW2011_GWA2_40_6]|uniref:50S ribosomal protein L23 n=2 Tax=Candidatus Shapironibacteriota TaxID=1752721 RepID=A0A2M7TT05_9BACT|nr:MAG: 50S ribosomal protein L23 [Microgenomates group bacterium GW2011_GWA2_40_6]PIU73494.1 MAG: 50S ribosomal protein L23 [Candidatus Shapirobacteria bacterium CG06_land_8_20_14_3_00_40_12]PIZ58940.1 MAG: 50S ribosomal protein L23 [Candidatus Shapirobacteria bacterium CG_4_10_14_0_2_um_filter_40_12]
MFIKRPLVTEKAISAQSKGKYSFVVEFDASKINIASEFFHYFGIKPLKVNTYRIGGKIKTNWKTRKSSSRADVKKAVITIPADQKIDLLTLKNDQK